MNDFKGVHESPVLRYYIHSGRKGPESARPLESTYEKLPRVLQWNGLEWVPGLQHQQKHNTRLEKNIKPYEWATQATQNVIVSYSYSVLWRTHTPWPSLYEAAQATSSRLYSPYEEVR